MLLTNLLISIPRLLGHTLLAYCSLFNTPPLTAGGYRLSTRSKLTRIFGCMGVVTGANDGEAYCRLLRNVVKCGPGDIWRAGQTTCGRRFLSSNCCNFRSDCFSTLFFQGCLKALLVENDSDFPGMIESLGRKWTNVISTFQRVRSTPQSRKPRTLIFTIKLFYTDTLSHIHNLIFIEG